MSEKWKHIIQDEEKFSIFRQMLESVKIMNQYLYHNNISLNSFKIDNAGIVYLGNFENALVKQYQTQEQEEDILQLANSCV